MLDGLLAPPSKLTFASLTTALLVAFTPGCLAELEGNDPRTAPSTSAAGSANAGQSGALAGSAGTTQQPGSGGSTGTGTGGSSVASGGTSSSGGAGGSGGSGGSSTPTSGGSGFLIDGVCYPPCQDPDSVDGEGWGWENDGSCVVPGSNTANRGTQCGSVMAPPDEPPPPVSGTIGGGTCPDQSSYACPTNLYCGCQIVSALGQHKVNLTNAGASRYMLAAAMMETLDMTAASYAYGDGKWGDSFNAGVAKQNWLMMRACHTPWNGLDTEDYATSAALNSDLALDVQVFTECRSYYGSQWWAGHRAGQSGLDGTHSTDDIDRFKRAMDWTNDMLEGHFTDDVRFWVDVPAI